MKNHRIIFSGLSAFALAVAILGGLLLSDNKPGKDASGKKKIEYLASDDFSKLKNEKKQKYLKQLSSEDNDADDRESRELFKNMDEDQQIKLMANMMQAFQPMIEKKIDKFEQLDKVEQNHIINKIIDSIVKRRKQRPEAGRPDHMADISPKVMNAILENTTPRLRGHLNNFKKRLNQRLKENNLKPIP